MILIFAGEQTPFILDEVPVDTAFMTSTQYVAGTIHHQEDHLPSTVSLLVQNNQVTDSMISQKSNSFRSDTTLTMFICSLIINSGSQDLISTDLDEQL